MSEEIVQDEVVEEETSEEVEAETTEEVPAEETDWKAKAEELEKTVKKQERAILKNKKEAKQEITNTGSEKSDEIPDWGRKIIASEEKREFGHSHGLTPQTVDAVFQFTQGSMPTESDMENPAVKAIIKSLEASNRVANNTPQGGGQPTYKGKTYAETVTSDDASADDKQSAFEAAKKKHGIK